MAHIGIPTPYAGALFRSQLEAHWAAFLDLLGWRWTYEPFELLSAGRKPGHIPDFALAFPHQTVMLSIKPFTREEEARSFATAELVPVNWAGEWMVGGGVGPWGLEGVGVAIGLLSQRDGGWATGLLGVCDRGKNKYSTRHEPHLSLQHMDGGYACYVCGHYPGGILHTLGKRDPGIAIATRLWNVAGNTVRWKARNPDSPPLPRLLGPLNWDEDGRPGWDLI